jgi:hypothetical protein
LKTAVIYFSRTGHSQRIAEAVAENLGVEALNIKEKPYLNEVDLLYVVGGIYSSRSSPELQSYLMNIVTSSQVKQAVILTSCLSNSTKQHEIRAVLRMLGIDVDPDEFVCKGSFLFFGKGHPNDDDVNNAVAFSNRMLIKYSAS